MQSLFFLATETFLTSVSASSKRWAKMVELVDNPIKVGNPSRKVARVFVALAQRTNATKVLANRILCEWQIQLKMKKPNQETKCP